MIGDFKTAFKVLSNAALTAPLQGEERVMVLEAAAAIGRLAGCNDEADSATAAADAFRVADHQQLRLFKLLTGGGEQ